MTAADEFILVCDVFEPQYRLRSLDIARQAWPSACGAALP
jgi:hypothetical protein